MSNAVRGRAFIDTNVLVYLFDTAEPAKQQRARSLLSTLPGSSIVLSAQVLSEFYWVTTRRLATPLDHDVARAAVERFARFTVVGIDKELVRGAIDLAEAVSIPYWDALVVEAARAGACRRILSEDLNHGQEIEGVRIENPFLDPDNGDAEPSAVGA